MTAWYLQFDWLTHRITIVITVTLRVHAIGCITQDHFSPSAKPLIARSDVHDEVISGVARVVTYGLIVVPRHVRAGVARMGE